MDLREIPHLEPDHELGPGSQSFLGVWRLLPMKPVCPSGKVSYSNRAIPLPSLGGVVSSRVSEVAVVNRNMNMAMVPRLKWRRQKLELWHNASLVWVNR